LKFDVTVDGNTCQTYKNVPASRLAVTAKADSGDLVEACQTRIARWEDVVPLEKIVAEERAAAPPEKNFISIQRHRRRRSRRR
jgi:hypothetical protein